MPQAPPATLAPLPRQPYCSSWHLTGRTPPPAPCPCLRSGFFEWITWGLTVDTTNPALVRYTLTTGIPPKKTPGQASAGRQVAGTARQLGPVRVSAAAPTSAEGREREQLSSSIIPHACEPPKPLP